MERRVEVRPFGVRMTCDSCKQGEMIALSGTQAFVQEQGQIFIRHVCNVCRTMATYAEKYPTVRYEDIPGQSYAQNFGNQPGQPGTGVSQIPPKNTHG